MMPPGAEVVDLGIVPDRLALAAAIAARRADLPSRPAARRSGNTTSCSARSPPGRTVFWKIAIGRAATDAGRQASHVLGLPGNPVSPTFAPTVRGAALRHLPASRRVETARRTRRDLPANDALVSARAARERLVFMVATPFRNRTFLIRLSEKLPGRAASALGKKFSVRLKALATPLFPFNVPHMNISANCFKVARSAF
jgi:hypothetical protein